MPANKIVIIITLILVLIFALVYFNANSESIIQQNKSKFTNQLFLSHNLYKTPLQQDIQPLGQLTLSAEQFPKFPFTIGEKLNYGIYSNGIRVGRASISYLGIKKIGELQLDCVLVEAKAPGFNDKETIYGDIKNFTPVRIEREIRLFGEDILITEEYDTENNEVVITRKAKKTTVNSIKSNEKISNIILLLYFYRLKSSFVIGDNLGFNLPTKKLKMQVVKEAKIKVPKGKFEAIFIQSEPPQFKVWFDVNKTKLPLKIQGAIGFGNTYMSLIDVEE